MLSDRGWTQDPAAQFSSLFPHNCFFGHFMLFKLSGYKIQMYSAPIPF